MSNNKLNQSNNPPKPSFIIHTTKQITSVLFSILNTNRLYVGNRDGEIQVYELDTRRPIFKSNLNNQSITSIIEMFEANKLLVYCRNGSLFEIKIDVWVIQCNVELYYYLMIYQ
jgi:hypothetical protein